jgi:undecaprenyl-diphosphatase
VMLAVERYRPEPTVMDAEHTPMRRALGIGIWQLLALVPGVSRSGATIVGGMMLGLDRAAAAEFSFFLAMPTMMAAFVYSLLDEGLAIPAGRAAEIAVGFVMAFISAWLVVQPFLQFVRRAGFVPFAWYRIVLGAALLAVVLSGWQ